MYETHETGCKRFPEPSTLPIDGGLIELGKLLALALVGKACATIGALGYAAAARVAEIVEDLQ